MTPATERVRIPRPGGTLDGEWYPGDRGGAVVAPPHPEYGGARSHPVVQTLARVLAAAGRATLAFDWRGVGGSDGRPTGDPTAATDDYGAAAAVLAERAPGPWIAAGYSFGAATALAIAAVDPSVCGLLLVAPPVAMTGTQALAACALPVGIVVGAHDEIALPRLLETTVAAMPAARLEVLPGVDHFFLGGATSALERALAQVLPTAS